MNIASIYGQLKDRHVIRAAAIYIALAWVAIQVADLLVDAEVVSEQSVRWFLLAALAGFPVVLVVSWLYDVPWRERKTIAVAGDVVIITAIAAGAAMLAWRQWVVAISTPSLAVTGFVVTDTRDDTKGISDFISTNLLHLLASHPEIEIFNAIDLPVPTAAGLVLDGTVNQGNGLIRFTPQLHSSDGELIWTEYFEDQVADLGDLQDRIFTAMWPHLSLPETALAEIRAQNQACTYPQDEDAMRSIVAAFSADTETSQATTDELNKLIEAHDNGQLHMARANAIHASKTSAPRPRQSVLHRMAMQDLDHAERLCPGYGFIDTLRAKFLETD